LPNENYNDDILWKAAEAISHIRFEGAQESKEGVQGSPDFNPYEPVSTSVEDQKQIQSEEYQVDFIQKGIEAEKEKRRKAALTEIKDRELKIFKIKPNEKLCINI